MPGQGGVNPGVLMVVQRRGPARLQPLHTYVRLRIERSIAALGLSVYSTV